MRFLSLALLVVLLGGCGVFGYNTLDDEIREQRATQESAADLNKLLKQHYEKGEKFYKEGKLGLAEVEFKAMLKLKQEEENALYRLGTISFKQRKYDAAGAYFERTVKTNPRNSKAHYNLASVRLLQAENHYKYYAALAEKDQDLSSVTELLGNIDKFNSGGTPVGDSESLDKIAGALKK